MLVLCVIIKKTKFKSTVMKKLVLSIIVTTAFAFSVQSQNSTATGKSADATDRNDASDTRVTAAGTSTSSISNQAAADALKTVPVEKKGCFRLASISLSSGSNTYRNFENTEPEFGHKSKDHYSWTEGNMMKGSGNTVSKNQIVFELGLNPWSKKSGNYNKKQELTIGLIYTRSNYSNLISQEYFSTPGDTFTNNSVNYRTDTLLSTQIIHAQQANLLGIGVQYLFKTDPERRLSAFTGVGIDAAFSITSRIFETHLRDSAVAVGYLDSKPENYDINNGKFLGELQTIETITDPNFTTSIAIPFGLNLRLCKKKEILNQFNLVFKGSLGLEAEFIVNHKPHFNPFMGMSIGLKFDFK
jgi:hypothetical protein